MERDRKKIEYSPQGTKDCEAMCNREIIFTKDGPIIVCHGCKRIVRKIKR